MEKGDQIIMVQTDLDISLVFEDQGWSNIFF